MHFAQTLLLLLLVTCCKPLAATPAMALDTEALHQAISQIATQHNIPSIAYAVASVDEVLVADAVGMADKEQVTPATANDLYRVGSITKCFVALGILKQVHEGNLHLDAKLSDLVPDLAFTNPWEDTHPIRLRHLLEHSSGLPDFRLHEFLLLPGSDLPDLENLIKMKHTNWLCRWQPGTRFAYSNLGYTLIGYILERTVGKSYDSYLRSIILEPAAMAQSDFLGRDLSSLVISHDAKGVPLEPRPINDHPAGYLHSTASDMGRWIHFLLNPPLWLPEGGLEAISQPGSIVGAGNGLLGYGLGFYSDPSDGHLGIGHDGGIEGFLSRVVVYPEHGVGYFFSLARMDGQAHAAVSRHLRELLLTPPKQELPAVSSEISDPAIAGWYRPASYRMESMKLVSDFADWVRVRIEGDQVVMQGLTGNETRLYALGNGYYRTDYVRYPVYYIGVNGNTRVISNGFAYWERGSAVKVIGPGLLFVVGLLLFLALPPIALTWHGIRRMRKRCRFSWSVAWPCLGILNFAFMAAAMAWMGESAQASVLILTTLNPLSLSVLLLSILQPVLWAWSTWSWFRSGDTPGRGIRFTTGFALAGWLIVLIFLINYRWIPLVPWQL